MTTVGASRRSLSKLRRTVATESRPYFFARLTARRLTAFRTGAFFTARRLSALFSSAFLTGRRLIASFTSAFF